jgi:hypothetical protein
MDAAVTAVWGVVRVLSPGAVPEDAPDDLAGLLVVGKAGAPPADDGRVVAVPIDASATEAEAFATAIRWAPASAGAVAWLDATLPPPGIIAHLAACLGARDAVVVATPVSDAVKQVRDGLVLGGLARDGLCRPVAPVLVRARVARERLVPALDDGHDLFAALGVAGCTVTVVAPGALAPG